MYASDNNDMIPPFDVTNDDPKKQPISHFYCRSDYWVGMGKLYSGVAKADARMSSPHGYITDNNVFQCPSDDNDGDTLNYRWGHADQIRGSYSQINAQYFQDNPTAYKIVERKAEAITGGRLTDFASANVPIAADRPAVSAATLTNNSAHRKAGEADYNILFPDGHVGTDKITSTTITTIGAGINHMLSVWRGVNN